MTRAIANKVLIMAGGTGGHVFPALTIGTELLARGLQVEWLGTRHGLEARVIGATKIPLHFISITGLRGASVFKKILAPFFILIAVLQAVFKIWKIKPVCVLGMGGFVTGPGGLAARILGKKLLIHEQNAVAGLTNQLLFPFANVVMEAFPGAFLRKNQLSQKSLLRFFTSSTRTTVVGNPVRSDILSLAEPAQRFAAHSGKLRLLVLGGSLGAKAINEIMPLVLASFSANERPLIRHQCGNRNLESTTQDYLKLGLMLNDDLQLTSFIDDMAAAYGWADIIICRAGASTIAEIAAIGLASILVPYPHAVDDHQTANAQILQQVKAAKVFFQHELSVATLAVVLREYAADRGLLLKQAQAARTVAIRDASSRAADLCEELCRG
jgi:UDP-N-acetylglucosamine--N-acetylmuramyl-(pentapeptide) pyrophosphoryl-undecaprenol N-acetylglucosamine transferase